MSNYCAWHKVRYETPECSKCALMTWSDQRKAGWVLVVLIWPVWLAGIWIGLLCGAFWSGFKSTRCLWADSVKWIGAPKPGRREES